MVIFNNDKFYVSFVLLKNERKLVNGLKECGGWKYKDHSII